MRPDTPTSRDTGSRTPSNTLLLGALRRERLAVIGTEEIGLYTLLRLERGGLDPGIPGQFFMLEAPGCVLPRPFSLCQAPTEAFGRSGHLTADT